MLLVHSRTDAGAKAGNKRYLGLHGNGLSRKINHDTVYVEMNFGPLLAVVSAVPAFARHLRLFGNGGM